MDKPRLYKKSRGHADRDALLDIGQPIGGSKQIMPIMLDGSVAAPDMTIRSAYDRNHEFVLARRYRDALADIGDLVDPNVGLEQNLASLRERIGAAGPTTDPLALIPYAILSAVRMQAAADARVATLNVAASLRYDNQGGRRYACNCHAADHLQFHPDKPYLPRVWWTREGSRKLAAGATEFGVGDYFALNSNDLNRWFHNSSKRFGWVKQADNDIDAAQAAANLGHAVIASARGVTEAGHIAIVAPEDQHNGVVADRRNGKIVVNAFVRSQAGAVNVGRAVSYQSTNVFDENHEHAGIWRYHPALDESLALAVVEVG